TSANGSSWSTPSRISNVASNHGAYVYTGGGLVVDGSGIAHVTWIDQGPNAPYDDQVIYADDQGGTWSTPVNLSNSAAYSDFSVMAVDATNHLHLIWQDNGTSPSLYYRTTAALAVGPPPAFP